MEQAAILTWPLERWSCLATDRPRPLFPCPSLRRSPKGWPGAIPQGRRSRAAAEQCTRVPAGIAAQQYNALRILKSVRPGALSTSAVGARLVSRAADMTRLLDKLEEQGLVARKRCEENRRVVYVAITTAGVAVVGRLAADVKRLGKHQLGHLDRRTLRTLIEILSRAREPHEDPAMAAAWPGSRHRKQSTKSEE